MPRFGLGNFLGSLDLAACAEYRGNFGSHTALYARAESGAGEEPHMCGGEGRTCGRGAPHVRGRAPHMRQSGQIRGSVLSLFLARLYHIMGTFL